MPEFRYCPHCAAELQPGKVDQRRVCVRIGCGFIHWNNPVPVVAAIVLHRPQPETQEHVLLVNNVGWPEGMLALVSGFVESGETPEQGIVREIKEELGLSSTAVRFLGHYPFAQANQLLLVYEVHAEGEIVMDTSELAAYKHLAINKLKAWPIGTGPAVQAWLDQQNSNA